jgi:hypothetical protein
MQELLKTFRKKPLLQVDARRRDLNEWYKKRYGKYPDGNDRPEISNKI